MELYTLDRGCARTGLVSEFESLVWTTALWDHGRFSIKCQPQDHLLAARFLCRSDTDEAMFVTRRHIVVEGSKAFLELEGAGASWLLSKRVNWWTHVFEGTPLAGVVSHLITDAQAEMVLGVDRSIEAMGELVDLADATELITKQLSWAVTSEAIFELVRAARLGFGVMFSGAGLAPYLARGVDRSNSVVFAAEFNDVTRSERDLNLFDRANMAVVAGEGEGSARIVTTATADDGDELAEMFVDARDLQTEGGETTIAPSVYLDMLAQRGAEALADINVTDTLSATVDESRYRFGVDYAIGDRAGWRSLGLSGSDIISEVTETFEKGAKRIDIGLGMTEPTVRQYIERKR
jgi:hypothetical protein